MVKGDLEKNISSKLWEVQPKWVKALALFLMFPAWILLITSTFFEKVPVVISTIAFIIFILVGIIELVFVAAALVRNDI